jgi:hypothetical protein
MLFKKVIPFSALSPVKKVRQGVDRGIFLTWLNFFWLKWLNVNLDVTLKNR